MEPTGRREAPPDDRLRAIRGRSLVLGFYHRARFARAIGSMRATKHRLNGRRPMFALARVKYDPPSRSLRCHLNGMAYIKPPLLHVAFSPRSTLSGLAFPTLRSKISAYLPPALTACNIHLLSRPRRDPRSPEAPIRR